MDTRVLTVHALTFTVRSSVTVVEFQYFKFKYKNYIDLVSINEKGVIWFKLKKEFSCSQNDLYFCLSYIPPEVSLLYKNINFHLYLNLTFLKVLIMKLDYIMT